VSEYTNQDLLSMKLWLADLEPHLLKILTSDTYQWKDVAWEEADGLQLRCPKCFVNAGHVLTGVHHIICWFPQVGQEHRPGPGRWAKGGTSLADLTLDPPPHSGSRSVALQGGCNAHFHITNGEVTFA
jgi:hypothetical protein